MRSGSLYEVWQPVGLSASPPSSWNRNDDSHHRMTNFRHTHRLTGSLTLRGRRVVLVPRRDVDFLQKPPTRLEASNIRCNLSHELSNCRPLCHVWHHGDFGVQPKRACWR
jgi:hypothetical protein